MAITRRYCSGIKQGKYIHHECLICDICSRCPRCERFTLEEVGKDPTYILCPKCHREYGRRILKGERINIEVGESVWI